MTRAKEFAGILPRSLDTVRHWSNQLLEDVLEPDREIVDPHHHLWHDSRRGRYLSEDLFADLSSGHAVTKTVYIQSIARYRREGPEVERSLGETEFAADMADLGDQPAFAGRRMVAGIVAFLDLTAEEADDALFQRHRAAAGGRLRGIRHSSNHDASGLAKTSSWQPPAGLLLRPDFRRGFARIAGQGLTFDAFMYHPQLPDLIDLARAFPDTTIILDHVGGPLGVGPYAGRGDEVFAAWRTSLRDLATCANVHVKLGGLGMLTTGLGLDEMPLPPSSALLAELWRPFVETAIDCFGVGRAMFESNFPVDMQSCSYRHLWNAFKIIASGCSEEEKAQLFCGNATTIYRLDRPPNQETLA